MKIYKNRLFLFGFLMVSSLFATTEGQPEAIKIELQAPVEISTQSFVDKVKNIEWMNGIDAGKKGLINGFVSELIPVVVQAMAIRDKNGFCLSSNDPRVHAATEASALLLDAMSKETHGVEYGAEQVGRAIFPLFFGVLLKDDPSFERLELVKSSVQRLCASSVDDFEKDPKVIARAATKTGARFFVELLRVIQKKNPSSLYYSPSAVQYLFGSPDAPCFASAGVNAFVPLAIDGGLAVAGDKFDLSKVNQKRISRLSKSVIRVLTGALFANDHKKPRPKK
jgi:hypothetical protein